MLPMLVRWSRILRAYLRFPAQIPFPSWPIPNPPPADLLGGPGVVEAVVRLAYGSLVRVGGHVVDRAS